MENIEKTKRKKREEKVVDDIIFEKKEAIEKLIKKAKKQKKDTLFKFFSPLLEDKDSFRIIFREKNNIELRDKIIGFIKKSLEEYKIEEVKEIIADNEIVGEEDE